MTTTTIIPRTITAIAQEFIAKGCPPEQAWQSAAVQFEAEVTAHHRSELDKSRKASQGSRDTTNAIGLPCKAVPMSKGELHVIQEPMACLVEGGENANSQFGPAIVLHLREYVSGSSAKPVAERFSSGSNLSVHESAETHNPCVQQAAILASSTVRLFARVAEDNPDGTQRFDTVEYSDRRAEWLELVRSEVTVFYDDLHASRSKVGKRRR